MPFKTHTAGGGWLGGATTTVPNCDTTQIAKVRSAFDFLVKTGQPCVAGIAGLSTLAACLAGKTEASVQIDCGGNGCGGNRRVTASSSDINICGDAFGNQADTDAALFHALVLSCGGMEIDAWALENHCYSGHGTRDPNDDVRDNVMVPGSTDAGNNQRRGAFVSWDGNTGTVTVTSSGTQLNVNAQPYKIPIHYTVGGGGGWL